MIDNNEVLTYINTWLPSHYRVVGDGPALPGNVELNTDYINEFYVELSIYKKYLYSFYSILMLCFGGDIGPTTSS